jgi:hypothetical protein
MTRVIADASLPEVLQRAKEALEVCDPQGRVLGYYHPAPDPSTYPKSPFSREEIERRRQQKGGDPLEVVLKRLEERAKQEGP